MSRKIEDAIMDVLKGDAQKNALDFVAYLRENEIPLEESDNLWSVQYKDEYMCFILIDGSDNAPGPWTIWSEQVPGTWVTWSDDDCGGEYVDFPLDDHIKEIALANINICGSCGGSCSPGRRKRVLGKEFDNVCNSAIAFTNPDAAALECAKRMIDARKDDINKNI